MSKKKTSTGEQKRLSNDDQLKLIEQVHAEELIYNKCHPDHMNVTYLNNAWDRIGNSLILKCKGSEARQKWANIRRIYRRKKKEWTSSKKSGAGNEEVKEPSWPLFKQLRFLDPYIMEAETESNISEDDGDDNLDDKLTPDTQYFGKSVKKRKSTFEDLMVLMKQRAENRKTEKDADDLFFASFASELKSFDIQTRSLIKEKIAMVFREARQMQHPMSNYNAGATLVQPIAQPLSHNTPGTSMNCPQYSTVGYYGTVPSTQPTLPLQSGSRNISENAISFSDLQNTVEIPFHQM